jgi:hypothetical protein
MLIHIREYQRAIQMYNLDKLARQGTQDEEKQSKNTTQYVLGTIIHN